MSWVRKIHKWASVLVGIQLLLWLISGLYFNVMDHTKAAGRANLNAQSNKINYDKSRLIEPKLVLKGFEPAVSLELITLLRQPYYLLTHQKGLYRHFKNTYTLVNAYSGKQVVIDNDFATRLAQSSFTGTAAINSVQLLSPPIKELPKQKNSLWQVNFANEVNTNAYIEAGSGRLIGHVDDAKRLADLFFMIHFIDYGSAGHFNSIQIMLFSFITLWLVLTGVAWTIQLLIRGKFRV
jgi:Na+-transporting NADH:ubiquinone oxidoreductase subunit F